MPVQRRRRRRRTRRRAREAAAAAECDASRGDVERGPKGKGVRELSKLLHDFGAGSTMGVEIGSKTRPRGAADGAVPLEGEAVAPLKKRLKLRQGDDDN